MSRRGVAVIGGGPWGVALAASAARVGTPTILFSRRPREKPLPDGVDRSNDFERIRKEAHLVILATPSEVARAVARRLGDHIDGSHLVVHGVRGLAGAELETVSEIVREESPARRVGALGGPALAADLLAGRPSVLVSASHYREVNAAVDEALHHASLRIYPTEDLRGLEWASALMGCLVIGVGYAQGLGLSPGLMAAVISRAVQEAARIAAAGGGEERTLLGLAGYGDLLASIAQRERPEVKLGLALGQGATLDAAIAEAGQRVEAIELIPRIVSWCERHGVRAPIFAALTSGVLGSREPDAIVHELMTGPMERGA